MSLTLQNIPAPNWRWIKDLVWRIEHAFERAKAAGRAEDDTRIRILVVLAAFSVGFVVLAAGAAKMALYPEVSRVDASGLDAGMARTDVVDRNGSMLAIDLAHYGLYLEPREIWDTSETKRALLAILPDLPEARIDRALKSKHRGFLVGGLTPTVKAQIHDLGLPGVTFEPEQKRIYPLGPTAAHLIGFADTGGRGLEGAEAAFNDDIRKLADAKTPFALSIDLRIQAALEDELTKAAQEFGPRGAVGVVTNVKTGEVLGMASWPTFDPNHPGLATDEQKLNRAASAVYEMGSTFKAFTVAIGLDTGVATPSSTFDARAPFHLGYRTIHDYHATSKILSLVEVFQHSSNIGTARLAEQIGPNRLSHYFGALGLTRPAKVELKESAMPLIPQKWDEDAVASTSFGHGIDVSPLALSRAMGALLNGGSLVPLTIRKLPDDAKVQGPRVVSEKTSLEMLQIMRANVTGGSGGKADVPGLTVGGKTGTGEKYDPSIRGYSPTKQVSSFAAVFPTDGDANTNRYFVLILLDEPHGNAATSGFSTGGWVAAPAAGRVIERIAPFLHVQRRADISSLAIARTPANPGDER